MDLPHDKERDVLGEHLATKLDAIHELVQDVPRIKSDLQDVKSGVAELKDDVKLVKDSLRDHMADKSLHN